MAKREHMKPRAWMIAVAILLFSAVGGAGGFGAGWWRGTTQSSAPMTATASHPVHWDDTSGRARFSDGTSDNYVSACVPSATGDICRWNASTTKWERGVAGAASTRTRARVVAANTTFNFTAANTYLIPYYVPSDVTQIRVRMNNREHTGGTVGNIITGVNIAVGTHDGNYGFTGAPTVYLSQTIPNGADWISPWIPIVRGTDGKVLLVYGVPGNQGVYAYEGIYHGKYSPNVTTVNPPPSGAALFDNSTSTFSVYIEYDSNRPRYVVLGDSVSRGSRVNPPGFEVTAPYAMGVAKDLAMDVAGSGSQQAQGEIGTTYVIDEDQFVGATVLIELGINDLLGSGEGITAYALHMQQLITLVRAAGAAKIWIATTSPCTANPTVEATRQIYIGWQKSMPFQVDGVLDMDAILRDPNNAGAINPLYDSGDGVHPNAAGHSAWQTAMTTAFGL